MKVVDETNSVRAIEEKISAGLVEELIYQAHNELKLIRIMKTWKPWEHLFSEVTDKEEDLNLLNIRNDNPFASVSETFENLRSNRPARKPSAAIHPEDAKYTST
jgi:hypothetical protein